MLTSAVQRRFPPGLKLLVHEEAPATASGVPPTAAGDAVTAATGAAVAAAAAGRQGGQLVPLVQQLREWGLSISRWGQRVCCRAI